MKVNVPVALNANTSTASLKPKVPEKSQAEADAATSKGPTKVIELDRDNKADLPTHPAGTDVIMQYVPLVRVPRVSPAKALTKAKSQSNTPKAGTAPETFTHSSMPTPATTTLVTLNRTPEDQVSASKEVMIQLELMNRRLREAYDAREALKTNVRSRNLKADKKKAHVLSLKKTELEQYIEDFGKKMCEKFKDFCEDIQSETEKIEEELDPTRELLRDSTTMAILRLDERIERVQAYLSLLCTTTAKIDKELMLDEDLPNDLESIMFRLDDVSHKMQSLKKSTACCGADVALTLVRVHCKDVDGEKLKSLKVANSKKAKFEDLMETFIAAATRIADGIDLDTFDEVVVSLPAE